MADNVPLYNPNDGLTGRDGGPYLDQLEAREAEKRRAVVEGREPNYEHPLPATAGFPLVTAPQQFLAAQVNNLPSQENNTNSNVGLITKAAADSDDTLLTQHSEIPGEAFDVPDDSVRESADNYDGPADPDTLIRTPAGNVDTSSDSNTKSTSATRDSSSSKDSSSTKDSKDSSSKSSDAKSTPGSSSVSAPTTSTASTSSSK